jgi:hypothetical protein
MNQSYSVSCDCGAVQLRLNGEPRVRGFCHCEDCRGLLDIPYHSVTAWEGESCEVVRGSDQLLSYQHPTKRMKRYFCAHCGETLFNTNAAGWRVVSQLLIRKNYGDELPAGLESRSHFFYDRRIVDIDDDLPKRP